MSWARRSGTARYGPNYPKSYSGRRALADVLSNAMTNGSGFDLGFLELAYVPSISPSRAFSDVIAYAKQIELSGFKRLWLAEHQSSTDYWGSPEIPLGLIARETSTLNVGTAGVLVNYHNPLHLASNFCFLEHVFPGRIDLGLARGVPSLDGNRALLGSVDDGTLFETNVRLIRQFLTENDAATRADTMALPQPTRSPRLWMLGSGTGISQRLASDLKSRYIHALFFRKSQPPEENLPIHAIAVAGFCNDNKLACESFAQNYSGWFLPTAIGDAEAVFIQITEMAQRFAVSEVVFLDLAKSFEQKVQTVRELATFAHAHSSFGKSEVRAK